MKKEIMRTLGHISHMHRYAADEMLSQVGVSVGQPPVMRYLSEHDGCIQRDIAAYCRISPASISSVLDKMEQYGYIERRGTKDDKRVQHVFMTELGWLKHGETKEVFHVLEEISLEGIDDEALKALLISLRTITLNIEKFNQTKGGNRG